MAQMLVAMRDKISFILAEVMDTRYRSCGLAGNFYMQH
jgi:hypothetical protein